MKKTTLLTALLLLVGTTFASAQEIKGGQKQKAERRDKSNMSRGTLEVQPNKAANTKNDANEEPDENVENTTTGVNESSTSSSGSPAVMTGDDGSTRDGTNTIQRAKPNNVAGASLPGGGKADASGSTGNVQENNDGAVKKNSGSVDEDAKKQGKDDRSEKRKNKKKGSKG